jgi:heme-degrading monooxygenase HmoA
MVIREWRGRAAKSDPDGYPKHFRTNVVSEPRQVAGFIGAHLSRRYLNEKIEFLVLTKWQSMDAIRAFAGKDIGKAVVDPGSVEALVDYNKRVQHYEVIENV